MTSETLSVIERPQSNTIVVQILFSLAMLFAIWTVACHLSTFGHIPWKTLSLTSEILFLPAWILCLFYGRYFARIYVEETKSVTCWNGCRNSLSAAVLGLAVVALAIATSFEIRFIICVFAVFLLFFLSKVPRTDETVKTSATSLDGDNCPSWLKYSSLIILIIIAVGVTLSAHRSDFDDVSYLQTAVQTLLHADHAPLTFDSSLGEILSPFRFQPYRLSSYELLVAAVAEWTRLDILTTYYVVIPAITAVLTVICAYLFSRWFLPETLALLSAGIFLAILFTWGETHTAYGNRVFVRLFQGKGLIIALTTPMTLLTGWIFLRRPSLFTWIPLFLLQIVAIGISSTGIVITLVVTSLLAVAAVQRDYRSAIRHLCAIGLSAIYPLLCGIWLKFSHGAVPHMENIGTLLPINTSLGGPFREGIALAVLIAGCATAAISRSGREFRLLVLAVLLITLDPWLASLAAEASARNMHWRIAWAAPIPLMMAIVISANLPLLWKNRNQASKLAIGACAACGLFLFLFISRPVLSTANGVNWGAPGDTVPPEYMQANAVAKIIREQYTTGRVLAFGPIGAWLTVVEPEVPLVMPGHTYPIAWQTVLPQADFANRMHLLSLVNGETEDLSDASGFFRRYDVKVVVAPDNAATQKLIDRLMNDGLAFGKVATISGLGIFVDKD